MLGFTPTVGQSGVATMSTITKTNFGQISFKATITGVVF
jgi:hypothetical protein